MAIHLFPRRTHASANATFALLPLAFVSLSALAQTAPAPTVPGAGQALQQLEPATIKAPTPAGPPALRIEPARSGLASAEASTPIAVKTIELSGNTVFDTATLQALVADAPGSTQTLAQLDALAQRITAYYRAHGQPLASAYLPVQTMTDGVLRIRVVEVTYGRVTVDNRSRIRTARLDAFAAPLQPGELVAQAPLDRTLLLLRELSGVEVSADARPGAQPGSTDLTITAVDAARTSGSYALDSQGSKAAGRARAIGSIDLSNHLGLGETFNAVAVTSGRGLNYGRLGLQMPVNGSGTRAGLGYAQLQYALGDVFANLNAHGSAVVVDGFVQQALVRSTQATVNTDLRLEHKTLKDRIDLTGTRTDRTVTSATAGLDGVLRDQWGGGGTSAFSLGYTAGHVAFDDATALGVDQSATGARTQGQYGRANLMLTRLQRLGSAPALADTTLFASLRAQGASKNLDNSEQISIAGPQGVRGYDVNALSGAQGYVASVELRQMLAATPSGTWQAKTFVDMGHATVYKDVFSAAPNSASMRSVGVGLNWVAPAGWNAQLVVARPVGAVPAIAADRSTRVWLTVGGRF